MHRFMNPVAVANLLSQEMQDRIAEEYGTDSPGTLFDKYYKRAYLHDIDEMKKTLVKIYNKLVKKSPSFVKAEVEVVCPGGSSLHKTHRVVKTIVLREEQVDLSYLNENYSLPEWRRIYFLAKTKEIRPDMSDSKFKIVLGHSLELLQYEEKNKIDKGTSLWYLNNVLKGTLSTVAIKEEPVEGGSQRSAQKAVASDSSTTTGAGSGGY